MIRIDILVVVVEVMRGDDDDDHCDSDGGGDDDDEHVYCYECALFSTLWGRVGGKETCATRSGAILCCGCTF